MKKCTFRDDKIMRDIGVEVVEDFITEQEEVNLQAATDNDCKNPWSKIKDRRVKHYGYEYEYSTFSIKRCDHDIPEYMRYIVDRISAKFKGLEGLNINQVTVQEYLPGVGIAPHLDVLVWGDHVFTLSTGSCTTLDFRWLGDAQSNSTDKLPEQFSVVLKQRSLALIRGSARYLYKHGIRERKTDLVDNQIVPRSTRWSYTMRSVKDKENLFS
jgi:alkylated DNA repair protein alkB family protein 8